MAVIKLEEQFYTDLSKLVASYMERGLTQDDVCTELDMMTLQLDGDDGGDIPEAE